MPVESGDLRLTLAASERASSLVNVVAATAVPWEAIFAAGTNYRERLGRGGGGEEVSRTAGRFPWNAFIAS